MDVQPFKDVVWEHYRDHGRSMPWRDDPNPYWVVVSEVMLQQTQVSRVMEKFPAFVKCFPSFKALASASSGEVIAAWQGLGYNRRALNLHRLANEIDGQLPRDPQELVKLPGIGPGTAGSIVAFAFDAPVVFIETNIRRVFIHHFFTDQAEVHDKEILLLVEATLDQERPREWYYALMDYGNFLAKQLPNPNRRSKHYTVQSRFEGSDRQLRGAMVRALATDALDEHSLFEQIQCSNVQRGRAILHGLLREGLVEEHKNRYRLPK